MYWSGARDVLMQTTCIGALIASSALVGIWDVCSDPCCGIGGGSVVGNDDGGSGLG